MNIKSISPKIAFTIALIFWVLLALILYLFTKEIVSVYGITLAFAISVVIMLVNYLSEWEGKIVEIKTETHNTTDSDGNTDSRQVTYAILRLESGKRKKIVLMPGWEMGDNLKKVKWEGSVKKEIK